ncbi:MAG: putative porin, partial [Ginsengibacter sp.]
MRQITKIYLFKTICKLSLCLVLACFVSAVHSQVPGIIKRRPGSSNPQQRSTPIAGQQSSQQKGDTLGFKHRDDLADSITISFRYLDSLKSQTLDSSLDDFDKYYTVHANYVTLGNNGSAAFPILFTPILQAGWDAGFHAYDSYMYTLENTRFFKTTRPFTKLTYLLASGKEQVIGVLHTQNIKPNWNAGLEYRLISSPGFFQTQNSNHNNYRFFSNYQGPKKRYAAYFVLLGNKLTAS